jgi:beta-hydroxylase
MRAAASPNETGDRTGGLNRAFAHIYPARLIGKRLRLWNRGAYDILKWVMIGGAATLIFLH